MTQDRLTQIRPQLAAFLRDKYECHYKHAWPALELSQQDADAILGLAQVGYLLDLLTNAQQMAAPRAPTAQRAYLYVVKAHSVGRDSGFGVFRGNDATPVWMSTTVENAQDIAEAMRIADAAACGAAPRAPEGPTLREALERCVVSLEGAINYHGKPAMYWENDLAFAREVLAGVPESTPPWAICGYPFDSMICVAPYGHAGAHVTSNDRFPHGLWNCEFGGGLK